MVLPSRPARQASLSAFLAQNPGFAELTRQRAISYWSCYYRARHSRDTYPALVALARLGAAGLGSRAPYALRAPYGLRATAP